MKKTTIALAALFCISAAANAESTRRSTRIESPTEQQKFMVGVDGDFGLPLGSYSDVNGVGGGLMLTGEYPMMPELSVTGRNPLPLSLPAEVTTTSPFDTAVSTA